MVALSPVLGLGELVYQILSPFPLSGFLNKAKDLRMGLHGLQASDHLVAIAILAQHGIKYSMQFAVDDLILLHHSNGFLMQDLLVGLILLLDDLNVPLIKLLGKGHRFLQISLSLSIEVANSGYDALL